MNIDRLASFWFSDRRILEYALAVLLARGHLLIEGPSGVGKSHLAKLLAAAFALDSKKTQGTADLLPSDLIGAEILNPKGEKVFHPGPLFCQLFQIDEINRIAPKTLSVLVEAMEEKKVTCSGNPYPLDDSFHVVATRSTREFEGIYSLPEAVLDRFMLSLRISLPSRKDEFQMIKHLDLPEGELPFLGALPGFQEESLQVKISDYLLKRILDIVRYTRKDEELVFGAGVRGSQSLLELSRALSFLRGEARVTLDVVEELALFVLSHRLKPLQPDRSRKHFIDRSLQKADPVRALKERFRGVLK
jgi:MoxR-like ATPase